jgi:hypothetical protein
MTTTEILPLGDNKHSYIDYLHLKEIIELKDEVTSLQDQVNCLQKSIANLREDLSISNTRHTRSKDRTFWIHR